MNERPTWLRARYSTALCWSSLSAQRTLESWPSTAWTSCLISGNRLMNLTYVVKRRQRVGREHRWYLEWRRRNCTYIQIVIHSEKCRLVIIEWWIVSYISMPNSPWVQSENHRRWDFQIRPIYILQLWPCSHDKPVLVMPRTLSSPNSLEHHLDWWQSAQHGTTLLR